MKFTIRLVGAIWLSVLIVIGGFAFLQIREERERLLDDLKRRAVLVGEGLKEAIEPQVARGSTVGVERILKKFGRPTRGIAVYDRFAGLMVATPEVAKLLPPSRPEVTDAVATNAVSQGFRVVGARPAYVYAAPLTQDERPVGALAVVSAAAPAKARSREAKYIRAPIGSCAVRRQDDIGTAPLRHIRSMPSAHAV